MLSMHPSLVFSPLVTSSLFPLSLMRKTLERNGEEEENMKEEDKRSCLPLVCFYCCSMFFFCFLIFFWFSILDYLLHSMKICKKLRSRFEKAASSHPLNQGMLKMMFFMAQKLLVNLFDLIIVI